MSDTRDDLVHLVRLALSEQSEDVRLFTARLVRRYRTSDPELAKQLQSFLRQQSTGRSRHVLRRHELPPRQELLPVDDESRLSLLKHFPLDRNLDPPLLGSGLKESLTQLIEERQKAAVLAKHGLRPTSSAMFVGAPGVGKTLTARWVASQLALPLYVLDLTAVMSSLLGKSGTNLRAALDFAKSHPCVLLLDEIDAIAKRRADDTDVGELKRLVTVILQEVENWPPTGVLLAATNHPELIDRALWRRFDAVLEFEVPQQPMVRRATERFLDRDLDRFSRWLDVLAAGLEGQSFSDIERTIHRMRRTAALRDLSDAQLIESAIGSRISDLDHQARIDMATKLARQTDLSQRSISEMTGVSRDTIRKHNLPNRRGGRGGRVEA